MRIQIVSDLHFEFGRLDSNYEKLVDTPADILVLAGDVSTYPTIVSHLNEIKRDCKDKTVLFVAGNHDYYGGRRDELDKELNAMSGGNLQVLIERDICIGGIVFIGSTGWWDGSGGKIGVTVKGALNDFSMIHDVGENGDGVWWGQKSRCFFDEKLYYYRANFPDMKRVCISHHFPHARSIAKQFRGSPLNVCFCNRWEDLIREYQPELWVHGHTHCGFDYKEGDTRIICNPQGYPEKFAVAKDELRKHYIGGELVSTEPDYNVYMTTENMQFVPDLVVEL